MKLINRYIRREILTTFAAVLLVLISILLVQRLAFYLNQVMNGSLSQSAVISLLGLQIIRFITELLPLSFLLAAILAFGRLYKDSEMTAFYALGLPVKRLYRILLQIGFPISILILILNFVIVPEVALIQESVLKKAREDAQLSIVKPGVFQNFGSGEHIVYVQEINPSDGSLSNVFIRSIKKDPITALFTQTDKANINDEQTITVAAKGSQQIDENNTRYIILENGSRTVINTEYTEITYFKKTRFRLEGNNSLTWPKAISWSIQDLLTIKNPYTKRELQRRLSGPISIYLLILLIPALAHSKPRQGRFNKLIVGVIFYVIYFNFIGVGLAWITSGKINPDIGIWWIQFIFFTISYFIYHRYNRSL